jgi:outer membrane murein-binding lipoprotein Lpp
MKKLLLAIVIAGSLSLTSCWKGTKNEESTTEVATDTTQVDSVQVDSVEVDTIKVDTVK